MNKINDLRVVVFDADGTLLNSFELFYGAYVHVAETHSLRVPSPEEVRALMGDPLPEIFRSLYPDENINALLETNSTYVAANTMKSEAFEGVEELLADLKSMGLKLAILTSGGSKIHNILMHHNWDEYFESVVHYERLTKPKPDAEGFVLAARECGVEPGQAVMVGDTFIDIQTGKNAGALSTIALTHGFGIKEDLQKAEPGFLVDSLHEIKPIILTLSQTL